VLLASCAVGQSPVPDVEEVVDLPAGYSVLAEGDWQQGFCDGLGQDELSQLVDNAIGQNLNMAAAWARLRQADSVVALSGSAQWPSLSIDGSVGRARRGGAFGVSEADSYSLSLPAAYEIDVWGRIAATSTAAQLDRAAARMEVESLATTLAAQVTETWLDIIHQRAALDLIDQQLHTNELFRELIVLRLGQGYASAPDILQQQQRIDGLAAQRTLVEGRLQTSEQQLAVLLGQPPQTRALVGSQRELPGLPPRPATGVPLNLLNQRPDVRSAGFRLAAANQRLAASIAARLPGIRLTGSLSLSATAPADLLEELFWSILGSISGNLLDGGRLQAEVDRNDATVDERLYQYGQSLLTAMNEVESALVLERQQEAYLVELQQQATTATESLAIERDRYLNGAADYLRVLSALQATQQVEQTVLNARRQLLTYRVQLCRAVGGDWTNELEAPQIEDDDS